VVLLEYQIRDANGGAVLVAWQTAASVIPASATAVSITVPAPTAVSTGVSRWYLVDFRPDSDDSKIVTTAELGMGELTAFVGQSLAMDMLSPLATDSGTTAASVGVTANAFSSCYAQVWNSTMSASAASTWAKPTSSTTGAFNSGTYNSSFVCRYLDLMVQATGVPCGMVGYAVGSQDIRVFLPFTDPNWQADSNSGYATNGVICFNQLEAIINAAGGVFGSLIFCQGHRNAINGSTSSEYVGYLQTLINRLAADYPTIPFVRGVCTIPTVGNYTTLSNMNIIRLAGLTYVNGDSLAELVDGLDAANPNDLVHPTQAGNVPFAEAFFRAIAYKLGLIAAGPRGPQIISARRFSGNKVLLTLQHRTGTALVGSGSIANQFTCYAAGGFTTQYTVSAVDVTTYSNAILITLSNPPSLSQAIDVWYRYPPDSATIYAPSIRDNSSDAFLATGRQLAMSNASIQAAGASNVLTTGGRSIKLGSSNKALRVA